MRALVTGANKGIGFGIANALGKKGVEILVGARDEVRGNAAVAELIAQGIAASWVKIDLNDFSTFETAAKTIGKIDFLINNAGISGNIRSENGARDMTKSAFAYTTAELRETVEVNFLGTHEIIMTLLENLTDDGKILNVTVPVSSPYWQPLAYVTSKAAQNVMTMAFGREFEKSGSKRQIFGVMPGAVATDLNGAKVGDLGGTVKSIDDAGENIVSFLFDGKNHNGHLVQFDKKEVTTYEQELWGESRD